MKSLVRSIVPHVHTERVENGLPYFYTISFNYYTNRDTQEPPAPCPTLLYFPKAPQN